MAKKHQRKSASKSKPAAKRERKLKTKPNVPGARGHNSGDDWPVRTANEEREAFLVHRTAWNNLEAKRAVFKKLEKDTKDALKADGFSVKQMQIADDLTTERGEQKIEAEVSDRLKVARWIGHPMGAQLDLFEQPDRTPIVDRAFAAGKTASMENKPAKPPHSPDTEAYRAWMQGYHSHQREIVLGMKEPEKPEAETAH
jgi:hypothetical protein